MDLIDLSKQVSNIHVPGITYRVYKNPDTVKYFKQMHIGPKNQSIRFHN